jgi:hypothetical protein
MCFVALFALLLYVLIATFFITARILLPWTILATVLAGLSSLGIGYVLEPKLGKKSVLLSMPITVALTIAIGYLTYLVHPPAPPPKRPQNKDIIEFLFTLPYPDIKQEDLWNTLPLHMGISGLLGAVVVASWLTSLMPKEEEAEAETNPFDEGTEKKNPPQK